MLYALLPVARNTDAAVRSVPTPLIESARAMGMAPLQILFHVTLPLALPILLAGRDARWLPAAGYRRADAETLALSLDGDFVLDGEIYPGGELTLRRGEPLEFVAP